VIADAARDVLGGLVEADAGGAVAPPDEIAAERADGGQHEAHLPAPPRRVAQQDPGAAERQVEHDAGKGPLRGLQGAAPTEAPARIAPVLARPIRGRERPHRPADATVRHVPSLLAIHPARTMARKG
jgi:hypothetical protein